MAVDQGVRAQGSPRKTGWLEGPRFIAQLFVPAAQRLVSVEILNFRGDVVRAVWHDTASGAQEIVELHPTSLIGMQWATQVCTANGDCRPMTYRVVSVSLDNSENTMPDHSDNSDLWLYEVEYATGLNPGPAQWRNACESKDNATDMGVFVNGRWLNDGSYGSQGYTFSCPSGVIAKCVRACLGI